MADKKKGADVDRLLTRFGFFLIVALLLVSIGLQAGLINPRIEHTSSQTSAQGVEITAVACAQAESTANAFRFRQVGPRGKVESVEHFQTRMLAQRHVLLAAVGLGCSSAKGFPPFGVQVKVALRQIRRILARTGPSHTASTAASAQEPTLTDVPGGPAIAGVPSPAPGSTAPTHSGKSAGHPGGGQGSPPKSPSSSPPESPTSSPPPETPAPTESPRSEEAHVQEPTVVGVVTGLVCTVAEQVAGLCSHHH